MAIEVIDNHSVRTDLLTASPVLDAGCRGFEFSKWFASKRHYVLALDPAPDVFDPGLNNISFLRSALVSRSTKEVYLDTSGDPGAWFVSDVKENDRKQVFNMIRIPQTPWDVIKLNVEGSEYDILNEWSDPIARQIVVSFHEHTPRARGRAECDRLIDKMRQWYTPFNVVWEKRYCCSENYWDVLFIRNDLA